MNQFLSHSVTQCWVKKAIENLIQMINASDLNTIANQAYLFQKIEVNGVICLLKFQHQYKLLNKSNEFIF